MIQLLHRRRSAEPSKARGAALMKLTCSLGVVPLAGLVLAASATPDNVQNLSHFQD